MSAFALLADLTGVPVPERQVEHLASLLAHRGPDGIHVAVVGAAAAVAARTATDPEASSDRGLADQPSQGVLAVSAARIDNRSHVDLRLALDGSSCTDTSRLLAVHLTGRLHPGALRGDFAVAVWDERRRTVSMLRDQLGVRPVYYARVGSQVMVASEIRSFAALPGAFDELDTVGITDRLMPASGILDRTVYRRIRRLPPAFRGRVHAGGAEVERYWEPDVRVGVSGTLGELAEETRRLTEQALVRRGTVHGPLALQLSGGLDSSSLVGVATRLSRSTSSPLPEVVAVSALYPGMACDETPFIRAVVEHTGVRWCGFDCSAGPTPDSIRRQIAERHEPVDSSDGPGGEEIRGWLRDIGASVLITGQGGDGLFATESTAVQDLLSPRRWRELAAFERGRFGDRHRAWAIDIAKNGLWRRLPSPVQHGVRRLTGRPTRPSWIPADRHRAWRAASARSQPTWRLPAAHGAARRRRDNTWFGHQALHLEEMDGTPGIELRHPYFDVDLVEFVARIDEQQHHTGQFSRVLQRAAFADDLPHVVRERRNKAEFSARLLAGAESHVEGVPEFDHLRRSGHVVPGALEALVGANRTLLATSPSAPGIALYSLTQALASEQFLAWYEGLRATGGSCSLDQDLTR